MINSFAVLMPSIKIGGGNRVLLQFLNEAIKDNRKCKLFYLDRKGTVFDNLPLHRISQKVAGDGILSLVLSSILLSLKIRFDNSIEAVIVSDPILSIWRCNLFCSWSTDERWCGRGRGGKVHCPISDSSSSSS